ncbi:MAG: four helix bundle protein [Kiritimatiellae bacterium]|nr:four helix bundle protein [Kiritimatiellia bacterium]
MRHAESFRDLVVYQKAREVARRFFAISKGFPNEERYSLTDQGRRSSRSIGAQIAEAWAKRAYEKHFVSKLSDADGEQLETQHWVDVALDCGYLAQPERDELIGELERIGRMVQAMKDKADLFCGAPAGYVRETTLEFFADDR